MIPVLTPRRVVDLTRAATLAAARSALDNARAASALLDQAIADRTALAPAVGTGLEPLEEAECLRLLAGRSVGRLAYVARAGTPDIAPVNYVLDGRDLLVRSGPGPKLQAAERGEVVAVEVDDLDEQSHTGWSVVVVGRASLVPEVEHAGLPLPTPWSDGPRRHVLRVRARRVSGRRLS